MNICMLSRVVLLFIKLDVYVYISHCHDIAKSSRCVCCLCATSSVHNIMKFVMYVCCLCIMFLSITLFKIFCSKISNIPNLKINNIFQNSVSSPIFVQLPKYRYNNYLLNQQNHSHLYKILLRFISRFMDI